VSDYAGRLPAQVLIGRKSADMSGVRLGQLVHVPKPRTSSVVIMQGW
jgi:hypothetical protein